MIRMFARRYTHHTVSPGTDRAVLGISLPSGSRLNNIRCDISLTHTAILDADKAAMYGCEAWILPVLDPDAATLHDTIWDTLVPKDTDVETIDLDTGATDTTPFLEPGEPDFQGLFEVGLQPERIYRRERILTIANGAASAVFQDNQTPFAVRWLPGDAFRINIRKNYAIRQPSVLLIGIANPALDDMSTAGQTLLSEAQWPQVKYIGHVLERALLHLMGLTETGAETPWEEATELLKLHLEPDVFESSAGQFATGTYQVVARMMVDHSVEGKLQQITVSSD